MLPITVTGSDVNLMEMRRYISSLDVEVGSEGLQLLRRHCAEEDLGDLKVGIILRI